MRDERSGAGERIYHHEEAAPLEIVSGDDALIEAVVAHVTRQLARLPHEYETALGIGHTIPNGPSAEPYARDTKLCCALIAPLLLAPDEAESFTYDDTRSRSCP
jgi:hypothetical protein